MKVSFLSINQTGTKSYSPKNAIDEYINKAFADERSYSRKAH